MPVNALHGESPSGMELVSETEIQSQALHDSIPNTREMIDFQPDSLARLSGASQKWC